MIMGTDRELLNERAQNYFHYTNGLPVLLRFMITGNGLRQDVEEKVSRYLADPKKRQTAIICSILELADFKIHYDLLKKINVIEHARSLENTILFYSNQSWKTIHRRWSMNYCHIFVL